MVKNYLLITLRSLMKNKLFILINISGLSIAIACCIVGYFNFSFNQRFDEHHVNASTIYRVNSVREFQNRLTTYGYAPIALGNVIKQNVPDVEEMARYIPGNGNFRVGQELFKADLNFVDPGFFRLFTFDFIEGDGVLKDKSQLCISDELAVKYFGKEKALGKAITQVLDSGKLREYVVAGVFKKQPFNSSFFVEAYSHFDNAFADNITGYDENSWKARQHLFLQVKDPSRVAAIEEQIKPYVENNNKIREDFIIRKFELESFVGMGVRDSYDDKPGTWTQEGSPIAAIVGVGAMGIFVLLIACFNLTNTAVAISSRRLKEIGIRKVMGSSRKHLIFQFIGETSLICFVSLLIGMAMGEYLFVPAFNELWPQMKLQTDYLANPNFLIFIGTVLVFTSLLAGSYPAFYITKFQPTTILKGKLKFGGTNIFTRSLLTLQFAISLMAIVGSIAFIENAQYQKELDLGFNKSGVVYTFIKGRSEYETYRNALLSNDAILSITGSQHHFYSSSLNDPIKYDTKEIEADIMDIGEEYIPTVGLTLKEGRNFEKDSENDRKESVIITEGLARKFGMTEPIGKEIIWMDTVKYYVVGVVKDVYNHGMWDELEPVMFRYGNKDKVSHILVSAPPDKLKAVNEFMEVKWKEIFPNKLYSSRYMDDDLVEANTVNNNILIMFVFLGVVALFLSATGLFTLVSLNIIKKMKEIGVRKVLGATMANISRVINTEFAVILLIASVLGGYGGAWASGMLMNSIWDYYKEATFVTMIAGAAVLLVTSVLSIGHKVYATTKLNPANVLRDE
jgi:putative ABC transport system permease protein